MNILFASAGRRVELLRAFRVAYKDLGVSGSIIAADADHLAPALTEADTSYVVPRFTDPEYVPALVTICRREAVNLVFPLIDAEIPILVRHRKALEATGAQVVLVSDEAAAIAADKLLTNRLFRRIGVPAPKSWLPDEARADSIPYPVFIKPRFGSAGNGCFQVGDKRELDFFLDYVPDPIVQEFLPGPEITNDVLCDLTGNVLAVVARRRIQVRAGEVAKGVTIHHPGILQYCVRIAKELKAIGPLNVQCIMRAGRPFFTEVNPRFGGGFPLAFAAGVHFPHWLLAKALGRPIDVPPLGSYSAGLHITRYDDSFFLTEESLRNLRTTSPSTNRPTHLSHLLPDPPGAT
jgi:carbamoyl-phosphate synthase large subunit